MLTSGSGIPSKSSALRNDSRLIFRFAYERIRQSILLVRAIRRFQKEHDCEHWPAVLAGGEPDDLLAYQLTV
jgi:hypothetical protein